MKKNDLEHGNTVELRNGDKMLFCWHFPDEILVTLEGRKFITIDSYRDNLTNIDNAVGSDIMKVYKDYTCKELLWERKEKKLVISEDEKAILRNVPKHYKWIARDLSGMVYIFIERPEKGQAIWYGCGQPMIPFYHLFQFIKWEDEEPYSIEELLKGEEK